MSYQVIARRWRPKSFSDLIGQEHICTTLRNALKAQRLPHALLFTGPRGTGKTSSARILAMSLRCQNAKDFNPCGQCEECMEIASGRSVDVIEIDGASNNGVESVRELRESVSYMPASGTYKIYIIDEVHMLTTSAFNALLKTLEEPPEHVLFILATTEVHKIPNTILSRCQRFDFRRIPTKKITKGLQEICQKEGVEAEEEALWAIARQGEGSMRDSQSLLDQVITYSEGKITLERVIESLGLTSRALLLEVLGALVDRDVQKIVSCVEKMALSGVDPKVFAQDLLEEIRHLLMVKLNPHQADRLVDLSSGEIEDLKQKSEKLSIEDIHFLFDMALKGVNDLVRAQDAQVVLEMLLLRMAVAPRIVDIQTVFQGGKVIRSGHPTNSQAAQTQPVKNQAVSEKKSSSKTSSEESLKKTTSSSQGRLFHDSSSVAQQWDALVQKIKSVNGLMGSKLEHSYLKDLSEEEMCIGVAPKMKFLYDQIKADGFQKKLGNYIKTFWGRSYRIRVVLDEDKKQLTPKEIEEQKARAEKEKMYQEVENHPRVQMIKKVFNTKIQSIKEIS
ncbi:MAG: DNA polymerase III subunit gamma/tau [Bdellovibrio sp.]|nr:MAG: DNA polymerase III subunit gamma/tau [Bdellovibrio sp.]